MSVFEFTQNLKRSLEIFQNNKQLMVFSFWKPAGENADLITQSNVLDNTIT